MKKKINFLRGFATGIMTVIVGLYIPAGIVDAKQIELSNPIITEKETTWDTIYFGSYWQNDTNGDGVADRRDEKEPIRWRVLSVNGDNVFLLADAVLDYQDYVISDNETCEDTKYKDTIMRSWLNGYGKNKNNFNKDFSQDSFMSNAFSMEEQKALLSFNVEGNQDKVSLLTKEDALNRAYGFSTESDLVVDDDEMYVDYEAYRNALYPERIAQMTAYASEGDNFEYLQKRRAYGNACDYGLVSNFSMDRSGKAHSDEIDDHGDVSDNIGTFRRVNWNGVRPVIHLDLSFTDWQKGEPVTSGDGICKQAGEYWYYIYKDEAIVCDYTGAGGDIVIPAVIEGCPVTHVASLNRNYGGGYKDITSIIFPDSIVEIGEGFQDFEKLIGVTWSSNLKRICHFGFTYCAELESVDIPECISVIPFSAFDGCSKLSIVELPDTVTEIENSAFYDCSNLEEIKLSNTIVRIGDYAFSGCSKLSVLKLPDTVAEIGEHAFDGCFEYECDEDDEKYEELSEELSFKLIVTEGSVGESYAKKNGITYRYPDGSKPIEQPIIDSNQDDETPKQENMPISSNQPQQGGVSGVTADIFIGETIKSNQLNYKVTKANNGIYEAACTGTSNKKLSKITIPAVVNIKNVTCKVTSIEKGAFRNNKKIKTIVIGKNVISIGKEAFKGCAKLSKITVKGNAIKKIGKNSFKGTSKSVTVKVPKTNKKKYKKMLKKAGFKGVVK